MKTDPGVKVASATYKWGLALRNPTRAYARLPEPESWSIPLWFRTQKGLLQHVRLVGYREYGITRRHEAATQARPQPPPSTIEDIARVVEKDGSYSAFTRDHSEGSYYVHHYTNHGEVFMWREFKHHPDAESYWDDYLNNSED